MVLRCVDSLNQRNRVRGCLSSSILGPSDDVLALECYWNALFLNWRWILVTLLIYSELQLFAKTKISKWKALGGRDILSLVAGIFFWRFDARCIQNWLICLIVIWNCCCSTWVNLILLLSWPWFCWYIHCFTLHFSYFLLLYFEIDLYYPIICHGKY